MSHNCRQPEERRTGPVRPKVLFDPCLPTPDLLQRSRIKPVVSV